MRTPKFSRLFCNREYERKYERENTLVIQEIKLFY